MDVGTPNDEPESLGASPTVVGYAAILVMQVRRAFQRSFLVERLARNHPCRVAVVHGHLAAGIDAAAEELALLVHGVERHVEGRLAVGPPPLGVAHAGC